MFLAQVLQIAMLAVEKPVFECILGCMAERAACVVNKVTCIMQTALSPETIEEEGFNGVAVVFFEAVGP